MRIYTMSFSRDWLTQRSFRNTWVKQRWLVFDNIRTNSTTRLLLSRWILVGRSVYTIVKTFVFKWIYIVVCVSISYVYVVSPTYTRMYGSVYTYSVASRFEIFRTTWNRNSCKSVTCRKKDEMRDESSTFHAVLRFRYTNERGKLCTKVVWLNS